MATVLDLNKKFVLKLEKAGINPPTLCARLATDMSRSMDSLYRNGWVNKMVDLFIGAALKFDDNGELEMLFFDNEVVAAPNATQQDGGKYMSTKGKHVSARGGTNFAPMIQALLQLERGEPLEEAPKQGFFAKTVSLFKKVASSGTVGPSTEDNSYAGIITDGACSDGALTEQILANADKRTFYQFIGIGSEVDKKFLDRLAKAHSNVGVIYIPEPTKLTPDTFYEAMCNAKFGDWIKSLNP